MPDYKTGNVLLGRQNTPAELGFYGTDARMEMIGWESYNTGLLGDGKHLHIDPTPYSSFVAQPDNTHNAFPSLVSYEDPLYGTVLSVYYRAGTDHLGTDGKIVRRDTRSMGRSWEAPMDIWSHATLDVRDASVRVLASGEYFMNAFYHTGASGTPEKVYWRKSADQGDTWTAPVNIPTSWDATGWTACSDGVLELPNGNLLLPVYGKTGADTRTSAAVMVSTDGGATWTQRSVAVGGTTRDYQEPALVRMASGTIRCMIRTNEEIFYYSDSTDGGTTWSAVASLFLGEGSPFLLPLSSGRILMLYRSALRSTSCNALRTFNSTMTSYTAEQALEGQTGTLATYAEAVELSNGLIAIAYGTQTNTLSAIRLTFATTSPARTPGGLLAVPAVSTTGLNVIGTSPVMIGEPSSLLWGGDIGNYHILSINTPSDLPGTPARIKLSGTATADTDEMAGIIFGLSDNASSLLPAALIRVNRGTSANYGSYVFYNNGPNGFVPTMRMEERGRVIIGSTNVCAQNTRGLTINQQDADDQALTLKSSDVAHGMTVFAETDTYFHIGKFDSTTGGAIMRSYRETGASIPTAFSWAGHTGGTADTTTASTSRAILEGYASRINTTTQSVDNVLLTENVEALRARLSGADRTLRLTKGSGAVYFDDTSNPSAWDSLDDVAMIRAIERGTSEESTLRLSPLDEEITYTLDDAERLGFVARDGGALMRNPMQMIRLLGGAAWQLRNSLHDINNRLARLEAHGQA